MFSGIIEEAAEVVAMQYENGNLNISLRCSFTKELKIDQSIAHNGVCLTVIDIKDDLYTVTAVQETLDKSNLGLLQIGSKVNLERSMLMNGRLDGHIVQGHVDQTAMCTDVQLANGSLYYSFSYKTTSQMKAQGYVTVEKGSIAVNGVSLTVVFRETISLAKSGGYPAHPFPAIILQGGVFQKFCRGHDHERAFQSNIRIMGVGVLPTYANRGPTDGFPNFISQNFRKPGSGHMPDHEQR